MKQLDADQLMGQIEGLATKVRRDLLNELIDELNDMIKDESTDEAELPGYQAFKEFIENNYTT